MTGPQYSIGSLVRRLALSLGLMVVGSWLLLWPRLEPLWADLLPSPDWSRLLLSFDELELTVAAAVDFAGFSLVFLGFFLTLYYRSRLSPRLRRLAELGEDRW